MAERYRITGIFAAAVADVVVFRATKARATLQARQWSRPPAHAFASRLQRIEVARRERPGLGPAVYRTILVGRFTQSKGWVWAEVANA